MRLIPFYRCGVRIAQSGIFRKLTSNDEKIVTRLRTGPYICVNLNDYIGRSVYYWGDYDRKIIRICQKLLGEGDCFLDIGANVGDVGLSAARFVGPSGQVHMFEPQPQICAMLMKSIEINKYSNVYLHQIALSDSEGEFMLSVPPDNTGAATMAAESKADVSHTVKVKTCNAGQYLAALNLPQIKAIKLDVEGHEEQVLAGAYPFLKANRPAAVIIELHDDGNPFLEREEVKLLSELDYAFFQIRQRSLLRVQLREITSNETETGYDFVAIQQSEAGFYRKIFSIV